MAKVAEEGAPERTEHEPDGEGAEGQQGSGAGGELGKELMVEHERREHAVE